MIPELLLMLPELYVADASRTASGDGIARNGSFHLYRGCGTTCRWLGAGPIPLLGLSLFSAEPRPFSAHGVFLAFVFPGLRMIFSL